MTQNSRPVGAAGNSGVFTKALLPGGESEAQSQEGCEVESLPGCPPLPLLKPELHIGFLRETLFRMQP